jgi:hypothetical protein
MVERPWRSLFKLYIPTSAELARLWRDSRTPSIAQVLRRIPDKKPALLGEIDQGMKLFPGPSGIN